MADSASALLAAAVIILWLALCLAVFRQLLPHLIPTCRRLALATLAVQLLVLGVSQLLQPQSPFEARLWNVNREFNIPSLAASALIALVAALALLTAWRAKSRPNTLRLYLLAIGLVFWFLALDEFFSWKSYFREADWIRNTLALGAATVAATLWVAARSPRSELILHACLLFGLATSALGGILFDQLHHLGAIDQVDEFLEVLGSWLLLIAVLGHYSQSSAAPAPRLNRLLWTLPLLAILLLLLLHLLPRLELRFFGRSASVEYETAIRLRGYGIDADESRLTIRLYPAANVWKWNHVNHREVGYSIHLIDLASGDSLAQLDEYFDMEIEFLLFGPDYLPVFRETATLEIAPFTRVNRAMSVTLTIWRYWLGEYIPMQVRSSDLPVSGQTQVVLTDFVLPAAADSATSQLLARFDNGFKLVEAHLPGNARAGDSLSISFSWHSESAGQEDHSQFLHFGHVDSGEWWVHDAQPLGPRLPTRLWYSGLADSETWQVDLPPDLQTGRYQVFTGLYRSHDSERVPASDANGEPFVDARVPLGTLTIAAR